MRYIRNKKNILINIILCLCSLMLVICVAEYALRKITIEGLSGYKIYLRERANSGYDIATASRTDIEDKIFKFDSGNCYPSNPTGLLPIKLFNPYDGKYWYCVTYDKKQRRQGYNPDRKRQIALVGDSFTFGEGVKETDTLGYLLNEKYPKINFQNWGKSGDDISAIKEKYKEIIESVPALDEVIYFYNLNDVRISKMLSTLQAGNLLLWQLNLNDVPLSKMMNFQQENIIDFQNLRWYWDKNRHDTLVKILSKSALFSLAMKVWAIKRDSFLTIQNYKDMYFSENNREGFLSTMDDVKSIKDMLAAHGISFRMVIYPLLHKDMLGRYPFEDIHAAIIKACNERGITCMDGYEPFKRYYSLKKFAVHPIDYHPNGLSNRELVDNIHKKLFITERP